MVTFKHLTLCVVVTTMSLVISVSAVPSRLSIDNPSIGLEGKDSRDLLVDINVDINTKPMVKRFQNPGESTSNIIVTMFSIIILLKYEI